MSTVYTHITPFPKRAINFFQQGLYSIGERGKVNSALDELFRKQEFFSEFRARHGIDLTPEQRAYINECAAEVETGITACLNEKLMLESLVRALNPCEACGGHGEFIQHLSQDDTRQVPCPGCGGDGIRRGFSADPKRCRAGSCSCRPGVD